MIECTLRELAREDLSGYVLEKDSPGCAMVRANVDETGQAPECVGRAVFAAMLLGAFPQLPVEEAGRLPDARLRENFVARVFAYRRLQDLFEPGWRVGDLVRFHTAHKLVLMSHAPDAYRALGRLVALAQGLPAPEVEQRYRETFMRTLTTIATPGRHVNVLQHMAGYFKTRLDKASKAELGRTIDDYRRGLVPLIVPITLLERHVRTHGVAYLSQQVYLDPHPKELMLRHYV